MTNWVDDVLSAAVTLPREVTSRQRTSNRPHGGTGTADVAGGQSGLRLAGRRRVCALFPLLPNPGDFIAALRRRFPEAEIGLYTANPDAARRAATYGVREVIFEPRESFRMRPPASVTGRGFDTVVVYHDSRFLAFNVIHLMQVLRWPGVEKYVCMEGAVVDFSHVRGAVWSRYVFPTIRSLFRNSAVCVVWGLMFLPALLAAWRRPAREGLAGMLWKNGIQPLFNRRATFTNLNPLPLRKLAICLAAVIRDAFRGPFQAPPAAGGRILIVRLDHIGDVILTLPTVEALHRQAWQVSMLVGPWTRSVLEGDPRLHELLVFPSDDKLLCRDHAGEAARQNRRKRAEVMRRLKASRYDVVVDLTTSIDATHLSYLPQVSRRLSMDMHRWRLHGRMELVPNPGNLIESERIATLVRAAGIPLAIEPAAPFLAPAARAEADRILAGEGLAEKTWMAIHTGASWEGRRWAVDRFVEIACRAHSAFGITPCAFFVTGEETARDAFVAGTRAIGGKAFYNLPLPVVFALLARARVFVGNDSGLMHAAAACDVPALGLFGPGELPRFRPYGRRVASVSAGLLCSPCGQFMCTDQRCIKELSVDAVWSKLTELLDQRAIACGWRSSPSSGDRPPGECRA
jgi:heptosyltransferase-3